jgi:4-carboxymuconolactone decarboxylase
MRIPALSPEQMTSEQRRIFDDIVASRGTWLNGPYAPMLYQPRMAEPAQRLGEFLRYHTSLGAPLSELAILVVARHWDCDFEWYQHAKIAARSEVPEAIIEAIRHAQPLVDATERQTAVYEFTRAILEAHQVSDADYQRAQELLGVVGVVELVGLIGYYTLIAFTLNAHQIPLPIGVAAPLPSRPAR